MAQAVGKPLFDMVKRTNPKLAACEAEDLPLADPQEHRRRSGSPD